MENSIKGVDMGAGGYVPPQILGAPNKKQNKSCI